MAPTHALRAQTWVITDRQHPVHAPADARVIELDAPHRLEAELSKGLPTDPSQAAVLMRQRLQQRGDAEAHSMAEAYQGVMEAWRLGIRRIPAVIVDGRYVVYGDNDVRHAQVRIAQYREDHL